MRDTSGNLYGVTVYGGKTGDGVVFKLTTSLTESLLFNFNGGNSGGNPYLELARTQLVTFSALHRTGARASVVRLRDAACSSS